MLTFKETETILRLFISSHLDSTCLNQTSMYRLQTVQNSAARFLIKTKRRDHITTVLASLQAPDIF